MIKLNRMTLVTKYKDGNEVRLPNVVTIQFGKEVHHVQYYPFNEDGSVAAKRQSTFVFLKGLKSLEIVPTTEEYHKLVK